MRLALQLVGVSVSVFVVAASSAAEIPRPASPGDGSRLALVGDRCPTFSWSLVDGARSYELMVYRLEEEGEAVEPVLSQILEGSISSWTPAMDRCLERGGRYGWVVRAKTRQAESAWSPPGLFEVAAGPSGAQIDEILAFVRDRQEAHPRRRAASEQRAVPGPTALQRGSHFTPTNPPRAPGAPVAAAPTLGPASLSVDGQIHLDTASSVFKNNILFLWSSEADGNLALGDFALWLNSSGTENTALGKGALSANDTGSWNTGVGRSALSQNDSGRFNTALGVQALNSNTGDDPQTPIVEASGNTAVGSLALNTNSTGDGNVAIGYNALTNNTAGRWNVAVGEQALVSAQGNFNTAIGRGAGDTLTTAAESSNIYINNVGEAGDANTLRIGSSTGSGVQQLNQVFIHGIDSQTAGFEHVCIKDSQLGLCEGSPNQITQGAAGLYAELLDQLDRQRQEIDRLRAEVARLGQAVAARHGGAGGD